METGQAESMPHTRDEAGFEHKFLITQKLVRELGNIKA